MARWRVGIIRKRAEHLGTIEAASEKDAIEKAAKEFDIAPSTPSPRSSVRLACSVVRALLRRQKF
jgi:hypothetical protein